jgi:shikimate kinase
MTRIVRGVAGSGKSTIRQLLTGRLGWLFYDTLNSENLISKRRSDEAVVRAFCFDPS